MSAPHILVIEDNPALCDMIRRRLERRGYATTFANNGITGLETARATQPDIVLLDMSLPQLDGWNVAKLLKDSDETKAIPIIAITAHAMHGDRERALEAGCNEFEIKPVDFESLTAKIEMFLDQASGNSAE